MSNSIQNPPLINVSFEIIVIAKREVSVRPHKRSNCYVLFLCVFVSKTKYHRDKFQIRMNNNYCVIIQSRTLPQEQLKIIGPYLVIDWIFIHRFVYVSMNAMLLLGHCKQRRKNCRFFVIP